MLCSGALPGFKGGGHREADAQICLRSAPPGSSSPFPSRPAFLLHCSFEATIPVCHSHLSSFISYITSCTDVFVSLATRAVAINEMNQSDREDSAPMESESDQVVSGFPGKLSSVEWQPRPDKRKKSLRTMSTVSVIIAEERSSAANNGDESEYFECLSQTSQNIDDQCGLLKALDIHNDTYQHQTDRASATESQSPHTPNNIYLGVPERNTQTLPELRLPPQCVEAYRDRGSIVDSESCYTSSKSDPRSISDTDDEGVHLRPPFRYNYEPYPFRGSMIDSESCYTRSGTDSDWLTPDSSFALGPVSRQGIMKDVILHTPYHTEHDGFNGKGHSHDGNETHVDFAKNVAIMDKSSEHHIRARNWKAHQSTLYGLDPKVLLGVPSTTATPTSRTVRTRRPVPLNILCPPSNTPQSGTFEAHSPRTLATPVSTLSIKSLFSANSPTGFRDHQTSAECAAHRGRVYPKSIETTPNLSKFRDHSIIGRYSPTTDDAVPRAFSSSLPRTNRTPETSLELPRRIRNLSHGSEEGRR